MTTRRTASEVEKLDPFVLELPPELRIEPKWKIALPGKHTAFIYDDKWQIVEHREGKQETVWVEGYRLTILKQTGRNVAPSSLGIMTGYSDAAARFTNLLSLKTALDMACYQLRPKTRTAKQRDDYEEE